MCHNISKVTRDHRIDRHSHIFLSIVGLWSTNSNVGNVLGGGITSLCEKMNMGITGILLVHAIMVAVIATMIWVVLDPLPEGNDGDQTVINSIGDGDGDGAEELIQHEPIGVSLCQSLSISQRLSL